MRPVYLTLGILLCGALVIGWLLSVNFYGVFEPELDRWQTPLPAELAEPPAAAVDAEDPHHYEEAGMEGVWDILAAPPARTAMITVPETYSPVRDSAAGYRRALRGVEKVLGPDWLAHANAGVLHFDLHTDWAFLDRRERDRVVGAVERARRVSMSEQYPSRSRATLLVVILRDAADVRSFEAALEPRWEPWRDDFGPLADLEADDVRFFTEAAGLDPQQAELEEWARDPDGPGRNTLLRARRGRVIVELRTTRDHLEDAVLARFVESVFTRLRPLVAPSAAPAAP